MEKLTQNWPRSFQQGATSLWDRQRLLQETKQLKSKTFYISGNVWKTNTTIKKLKIDIIKSLFLKKIVTHKLSIKILLLNIHSFEVPSKQWHKNLKYYENTTHNTYSKISLDSTEVRM